MISFDINLIITNWDDKQTQEWNVFILQTCDSKQARDDDQVFYFVQRCLAAEI